MGARAAWRQARGGDAPDGRAAVGAPEQWIQWGAAAHQAGARAGAHEPMEHATVRANVLVVAAGRNGVLARVRHVQHVPAAPPRQEAPPGRLGEAGHGGQVARHGGHRGAAAEEEQLRQRRPPATDAPRGRRRERLRHPRRPRDAEVAPQHAPRDDAEAAAGARGSQPSARNTSTSTCSSRIPTLTPRIRAPMLRPPPFQSSATTPWLLLLLSATRTRAPQRRGGRAGRSQSRSTWPLRRRGRRLGRGGFPFFLFVFLLLNRGVYKSMKQSFKYST